MRRSTTDGVRKRLVENSELGSQATLSYEQSVKYENPQSSLSKSLMSQETANSFDFTS